MNCDKCGKASVYHSTLIINGVSKSTNLCRDCAMKEGVFTNETSIFDELFAPFSDLLSFEKVEDIICPVCKTTLKQLKSSLTVGCPNCYEAFNKEIQEVVKRIAPFSSHKQDVEYIKKEKNKPATKQDKIAALRAEMAQAVKEERYEDAGKIKKKIQKLENENE